MASAIFFIENKTIIDKILIDMAKTTAKSKIKSLLLPIMYVGIAIFLSIGVCALFQKRYYLPVYIEGGSMKPTLNVDSTTRSEGGVTYIDNTEFGYVDQGKQAIKKIKRFDILTTYYKEDYVSEGKLSNNASFKIKRVIAMPNETFKIQDGVLSIYENDTWVIKEFNFTHRSGNRDVAEKTLGNDEYWVLGDNWSDSKDSSNASVGAIKSSYITGVLVAIEGTCTVVMKNGEKTFENYNYYSKPIYYL